MEKENFWKIFNDDKSVMILTFVPKEYGNGDGAYKLMKKLHKVFGPTLCGYQKFDERFDKIEDFDTILRVNYNIWGERLISATLFEYDKETQNVCIDRQQTRKVFESWEYTYQFSIPNSLYAIDGWNGFRRHLCGWQNFAVNEFGMLGTSPLIELDTASCRSAIIELLSEDSA